MRIYFQFLGWLLRKMSFTTPRFIRKMFNNYREAFINVWPLALLMSVLIYVVLALFVLIGSAMAQTSKQQLLDNEFYAAICMVVFVIYNWLAAWYGVFLEERQELMDTLAKP